MGRDIDALDGVDHRQGEGDADAHEADASRIHHRRRQAIDQVGLMDEQFFMYSEEVDWCYRFKKADWQIYYVPLRLVNEENFYFHLIGWN